jgi:hypothetical protein
MYVSKSLVLAESQEVVLDDIVAVSGRRNDQLNVMAELTKPPTSRGG